MTDSVKHISDLPSLPNDGPIFDYLLTKIFPTDIESGPVYKFLKNCDNSVNSIYNGINLKYNFNIDECLKEFTDELIKIKQAYELLHNQYESLAEFSDVNTEDFDISEEIAWNHIINTLIQTVYIYNTRISPIYTFYKDLCRIIKNIKMHNDGTISKDDIDTLLDLILDQTTDYKRYIPWISSNLNQYADKSQYDILKSRVYSRIRTNRDIPDNIDSNNIL